MDFEAQARGDVEETLRAGANALERAVAFARLGVFSALTLFTSAVLVILLVRNGVDAPGAARWPAPPLVFGAGAVYALFVWRRVQRDGARPGITSLIAFADIVVVVGAVVFLRRVDPFPQSGELNEPLAARFDIYCLAPILLILVYLSCIRVPRQVRVSLALFAVAAYAVGIRADIGRFEPPQGLAALLIAFGAVLGSKTSDRIAGMLDRHSRLSLLRSYLPESFAERVSSDSLDLGAALKPQALDVTLLVADLRGFTSMSEALPPAEVVALLGGYHEAMLEAVEANGGVVDKFLGDGLLVVFGLPALRPAAAPPDAGAGPAVRCARAMLERLALLNTTRAREGKAPLAMGIGIHTGPVVAGTIGAGRRREFTVIGDAVNTASRLEGLTKSAEAPLLISASTAARLDADSSRHLRALPPMPVKGKSEPLTIFAMDQEPQRSAAR